MAAQHQQRESAMPESTGRTVRNINRQRLLNSVVYFAANTLYCGKIKLFKLLYLLDFQHFRETGRSVTGADYSAWKYGPVPIALMEEWDSPESDFDRAVVIEPEQVICHVRQTVRPKAPFDDMEFTPRQLRIMQALAEKYKDTKSPEMIDVVHAENGAWTKVWQGGKGSYRHIPYELAVSDTSPQRQAVLERKAADDRRAAAIHAFGG